MNSYCTAVSSAGVLDCFSTVQVVSQRDWELGEAFIWSGHDKSSWEGRASVCVCVSVCVCWGGVRVEKDR